MAGKKKPLVLEHNRAVCFLLDDTAIAFSRECAPYAHEILLVGIDTISNMVHASIEVMSVLVNKVNLSAHVLTAKHFPDATKMHASRFSTETQQVSLALTLEVGLLAATLFFADRHDVLDNNLSKYQLFFIFQIKNHLYKCKQLLSSVSMKHMIR